MNKAAMTHDPAEIARFESTAARWWDPEGEFRPLHDLNPVRLAFIEQRAPLAGLKVLDVGCGGGWLSEAMARRGAEVTGIDLGKTAIEVASLHALEAGVKEWYRVDSADAHVVANAGTYEQFHPDFPKAFAWLKAFDPSTRGQYLSSTRLAAPHRPLRWCSGNTRRCETVIIVFITPPTSTLCSAPQLTAAGIPSTDARPTVQSSIRRAKSK